MYDEYYDLTFIMDIHERDIALKAVDYNNSSAILEHHRQRMLKRSV